MLICWVVWYGMVWYGIVLYSVIIVWYGMVNIIEYGTMVQATTHTCTHFYNFYTTQTRIHIFLLHISRCENFHPKKLITIFGKNSLRVSELAFAMSGISESNMT